MQSQFYRGDGPFSLTASMTISLSDSLMSTLSMGSAGSGGSIAAVRASMLFIVWGSPPIRELPKPPPPHGSMSVPPKRGPNASNGERANAPLGNAPPKKGSLKTLIVVLGAVLIKTSEAGCDTLVIGTDFDSPAAPRREASACVAILFI